MKTRISRSFLSYDLVKGRVFSCGYCEIPAMSEGLSPEVYNSGIYGWNYDGYSIGKYWILSGCRNMPGQKIPESLIDDFNRQAKNQPTKNVIELLHALCEQMEALEK